VTTSNIVANGIGFNQDILQAPDWLVILLLLGSGLLIIILMIIALVRVVLFLGDYFTMGIIISSMGIVSSRKCYCVLRVFISPWGLLIFSGDCCTMGIIIYFGDCYLLF